MYIATIFVSIFLSILSTVIMSYVSLAIPLGPWIAPTLILIGLFFSRLFSFTVSHTIVAGSIGGIIATACSFSFPTLYFLDPITFSQWMQSPFFFSATLTSLAFLAGIFGFFIADIIENILLNKQQLAFPIGQLSYKMISATDQIKKIYELVLGFCITTLFCTFQGGLPYIAHIISQTVSICPKIHYISFTIPHIKIQANIIPMIWAVGFVTGHIIVLPLAVGALSNIAFVYPIQKYLFSSLSSIEFTLAFCSGIILFITIASLLSMPYSLIKNIKKNVILFRDHVSIIPTSILAKKTLFFCLLLSSLFLFFSFFNVPIIAQLYLIMCSIITTYQISAIAGRIGLALLGRFATFVMIPAMLIFNLNYVHIVFIATFVEISGGVAADVLFGRKLGQLANIPQETTRNYQMIGLIISSLTVGIVLWFLINHFGLGSSELYAYRAQSRQLLIQAHYFNYTVLAMGAFFGLLLKQLNINSMLVLGGLLMPLDITLGLIAGGLLTYCCHNKEDWYPFWSGVFASNSIYVIIKAIFIP
jgi:hypothetical protein